MLLFAPDKIKKSLRFCEIKKQDKWIVYMIRKVTNIKQKVLALEGEGFSSEELDELIEFISTT